MRVWRKWQYATVLKTVGVIRAGSNPVTRTTRQGSQNGKDAKTIGVLVRGFGPKGAAEDIAGSNPVPGKWVVRLRLIKRVNSRGHIPRKGYGGWSYLGNFLTEARTAISQNRPHSSIV